MDDVTTASTHGRDRTARLGRSTGRRIATLAMVLGVALLSTGCLFLPYAQRNGAQQLQARPWWCTSVVGADR